ncbi:hypothetical protein EPD65_01355 [Nocardioides jejuensis]|uniref:Uncharacterized protein n=1 Tax=Nocardioides jejuensis TaxID=2502782 RepID=A0A4R1CID7_9ACTN|nr:hypothetical protein EPD65_01355 [Nocardioides jejuensis]
MPVRAWPIRSVPIRATERVISWIGKGSMMFLRSRASQISGSTPRSRKVVTVFSSSGWEVERPTPLPGQPRTYVRESTDNADAPCIVGCRGRRGLLNA